MSTTGVLVASSVLNSKHAPFPIDHLFLSRATRLCPCVLILLGCLVVHTIGKTQILELPHKVHSEHGISHLHPYISSGSIHCTRLIEQCHKSAFSQTHKGVYAIPHFNSKIYFLRCCKLQYIIAIGIFTLCE